MTLKFHQQLNQAPRSAKHGQHRRASPPAYRNPADGTDYSAGGSDQSGTVTVSWSNTTSFITWDVAEPVEPDAPAVPHAGIRTGELIGYRLWWVIGGKLCSLAHQRFWTPGETIHGDTQKVVPNWFLYNKPLFGGTYAFAERAQCDKDVEVMRHNLNLVQENRAAGRWWTNWGPMWEAVYEPDAFVLGTIKMWGDVIEHERGYRAEFAKINSIDEIWCGSDLDALRAKYGLA